MRNTACQDSVEQNAAASSYARSGGSTALASNVNYRLGKLAALGLLRGRWLDCGCADGGYTAALIERGVERAIGVELQLKPLRQAQRQDGAGPAYACAVAEALPFPDEAFDGVLLNEVLEHVAAERDALGEIYRVLRPGGHLALMSPNRWFPFEGHGMRVLGRGVPMPIPLLPWLPGFISRPFMLARNYWPGELRALVREAGFEVCHSSSVLPVFELYSPTPGLPPGVFDRYRAALPSLEHLPILRSVGVSTFVLGRKPA